MQVSKLNSRMTKNALHPTYPKIAYQAIDINVLYILFYFAFIPVANYDETRQLYYIFHAT